MSKKDLNVILKNCFKNYKEFSEIYLDFKKKLDSFKKKTFLVAVSGGPDSLALTALSKAYRYNNSCKIYYVLIDHKLRKNSSIEAISVKKLLKKHKIKLNIIKNNKKITKNIQKEARNIRYDLLGSFCSRNKIKYILTAHHLNDQVETFFIRLSRGSGLDGLSSMKQISDIKNNIKIVRPLLDLKKNKLAKLSKKVFGKYYLDPSNNDKKYLRIRIRKLKKILEKSGINYDQISKSIKNLASSRDTLEVYFNEIYKDIVNRKKNKISINYKSLSSLNKEMKMRIFQRSIKDFTKAYYTPRSKKVLNLIDQIDNKKKARLTLGGCLVFKDQNHIILEKELKK